MDPDQTAQIFIKGQILLSRENKKNSNLLSAESAQTVVKVKGVPLLQVNAVGY